MKETAQCSGEVMTWGAKRKNINLTKVLWKTKLSLILIISLYENSTKKILTATNIQKIFLIVSSFHTMTKQRFFMKSIFSQMTEI